MKTKLQTLKDFWAEGTYVSRIAALKLANSFPQLGEHKAVIQQGWSALTNQTFYAQINRDPEQLVELALIALCQRYNLEPVAFRAVAGQLCEVYGELRRV